MKAQEKSVLRDARSRLIEMGGRMAQDLGLGRIAGQVLVYLYLAPEECSLDEIEAELGFSKAAASIAARQLLSMGLLRRAWKPGDRRSYYRTADNLGAVFRDGVVSMLQRKLAVAGTELEEICRLIESTGPEGDEDLDFLQGRVKRARDLNARAARILNSRLLRYLAR